MLSFFDLTFQGQWDLFQVPCQPRSSGCFACLGSHPGLANCTGASIGGVTVARCTGCSSKLSADNVSSSFVPFAPRSLQQMAAAQELQLWGSNELPWSRMVLNRVCSVQKSEAAKL